MFCEECGAKNKKGAAFCEECGHKITTEVKEKNTKVEKPEKVAVKKEPMNKTTKILIGSIAAVVIILVSVYMYLSSLFTPEKIAIKYFKAYANKDVDKICDIIKLDESEFVNKKLLKDALKNEEKIDIENYIIEKNPTKEQLKKVFDVKEEELSKSITIKYVTKDSSKEKYKTIKLIKSKKKKFLFFTDWTVDSSDLIAKDYTFTVPKNSIPLINGVEVKDKYKKNEYSTYSDTYKIPSILKGNYKLTAKLKSGIKLSGDMRVNGSYGSFLSGLKLEKKTEDKLTKEIQDKLTLIYDSVLANKEFDEIKESFDEDYRDDIAISYGNLKQSALSDYNKLKEFKITNTKINYYNISDDELSITAQVKYDYKVEYKNGDETKEYSKTGKTGNVYLTFKLDKKDYVLSNIRSLISYFSHYSY